MALSMGSPASRAAGKEPSSFRSDMEFTSLERAVLTWMVSHTKVANLAEQLAACHPTERELTGVGSFTTLVVPAETPQIDLQTTQSPINGPWIEECEGIQHGGIALLFLDESGYVQTLELVANGAHFDETVTAFALREWIEPDAAINEDPAAPADNPNVLGGPPSMS